MKIYYGLAILAGILLCRWAAGYWRGWRLHRSWNRGHAAVEAGDLVAAEVAFRECVRLAPIYAPIRRILGRVLARRRKLDEAEEHFRMGAELEPRNAAGHLDLGVFLAMSGPDRADEAIDAFATAVECDPNLRKTLREEPRLGRLRENERFKNLLESSP